MNDQTKTSSKVPAHIRTLFGPPPVLSNEDPALYWAIMELVWEDRQPNGIVTQWRVKEVVDLMWEGLRLRRYNTLLIDKANDPWIDYAKVLGRGDEDGDEDENENENENENEDANVKNEVLPPWRPPVREIDSARHFLNALDCYERFNRLIASTEVRQGRLLREIELCRDSEAIGPQDDTDRDSHAGAGSHPGQLLIAAE
jgi:hypothetical protein